MAFEVHQIPMLSDNYAYIVVDEQTRETALVDAPQAGPVIEWLDAHDLTLHAVFNTHHHFDHVGANKGLLARYPTLKIYGYGPDRARITGCTDTVDDGETVTLGDSEATVMFIPGHTSGHIAYVFEGAVFCGDTMFVGGCGRLFEGTPEQMYHSLQALCTLPDDTKVYCAHEYTETNLRFALTVDPTNDALQRKYDAVVELRKKGVSTVPSTIGEEKATNPFVRVDSTGIRDTLAEQSPDVAPTDPVAVLAAVRRLKDQF